MVGAEGSAFMMLKLYSGNCSLLLLFAVSLIYLWIAEKKKGRKLFLVYYSVGILAVFLMPFLSKFVADVLGEGETYYRLLWALPMGVVIAYAAVKFLGSLKKKWLQVVLFLLLAAYIAVGGHLVYKSPQFSKVENVYQVPEAVIDICEIIEVPGREVMAVMPNELIQYVRQYSPYVVMPYGYDVLVERWMIEDALEEEMSKDISNTWLLATMARDRGCHFIVINQYHLLEGDLADYDYELIAETDGYDIYKDKHADLSLTVP